MPNHLHSVDNTKAAVRAIPADRVALHWRNDYRAAKARGTAPQTLRSAQRPCSNHEFVKDGSTHKICPECHWTAGEILDQHQCVIANSMDEEAVLIGLQCKAVHATTDEAIAREREAAGMPMVTLKAADNSKSDWDAITKMMRDMMKDDYAAMVFPSGEFILEEIKGLFFDGPPPVIGFDGTKALTSKLAGQSIRAGEMVMQDSGGKLRPVRCKCQRPSPTYSADRRATMCYGCRLVIETDEEAASKPTPGYRNIVGPISVVDDPYTDAQGQPYTGEGPLRKLARDYYAHRGPMVDGPQVTPMEQRAGAQSLIAKRGRGAVVSSSEARAEAVRLRGVLAGGPVALVEANQVVIPRERLEDLEMNKQAAINAEGEAAAWRREYEGSKDTLRKVRDENAIRFAAEEAALDKVEELEHALLKYTQPRKWEDIERAKADVALTNQIQPPKNATGLEDPHPELPDVERSPTKTVVTYAPDDGEGFEATDLEVYAWNTTGKLP